MDEFPPDHFRIKIESINDAQFDQIKMQNRSISALKTERNADDANPFMLKCKLNDERV